MSAPRLVGSYCLNYWHTLISKDMSGFTSNTFFLVSTFLRDCSLCWDCWNSTWRLHLIRPCLCSSRAGADLGRTSERFEVLCQLGFPHSQFFILITHVCKSRYLINIEHAHSGHSLPKWDSIHRPRVTLPTKQTLYPQATTTGSSNTLLIRYSILLFLVSIHGCKRTVGNIVLFDWTSVTFAGNSVLTNMTT